MATCHYCHETGPKMTRDHIVPVSRGGLKMPFNIVPACRKCNSLKSDGWPTCRCGTCARARRVHRALTAAIQDKSRVLAERWRAMNRDGRLRSGWKPSHHDLAVLSAAMDVALAAIPEHQKAMPYWHRERAG